MYYSKNILPVLIFIIVSLFYFEESFAQNDIIIIKAQNSSSYNQATEGLKGTLDKNGIPSNKIFEFDWRNTDIAQIIEEHPIKNIRVVFLCGRTPTEAILKDERFNNVPKIFMMVMQPVEKGILPSLENPGENVSGVTVDIEIEKQIELLRLLLPNLNRIGILYSSKSTETAASLTQKLKELGITVDSQFAETSEKVTEVFPQIADNIDLFMFTLDTNIFNKSIQKYFFDQADRYPICGITKTHVKSGLLCSVTTDYISQGKQAGELFFKLEKEKSVPIESPKLVKLYVNERTAKQLNIDIPHSSKIMLIK